MAEGGDGDSDEEVVGEEGGGGGDFVDGVGFVELVSLLACGFTDSSCREYGISGVPQAPPPPTFVRGGPLLRLWWSPS